MKTTLPIYKIEANTGQLPGLPENPRTIDNDAVDNLAASINQDPEMLELRPLLVFPLPTGNYIIIGGNARIQALQKLKYKDVPVEILDAATSVDKLKRYVLKDNSAFGKWDYEKLLVEYPADELASYSIDVPAEYLETEEKKRKGWHDSPTAGDALCDLKECFAWHPKQSFAYISCFKRTDSGYPLTEIKSDPANIPLFASTAADAIRRIIGIRATGDWCIVTTPKRRHKTNNFSEGVCIEIARQLGIPFHPDVAAAKSRQRIGAHFILLKDVPENNIILFDDIITTGSTLIAMHELFPAKNMITIVGIYNN